VERTLTAQQQKQLLEQQQFASEDHERDARRMMMTTMTSSGADDMMQLRQDDEEEEENEEQEQQAQHQEQPEHPLADRAYPPLNARDRRVGADEDEEDAHHRKQRGDAGGGGGGGPVVDYIVYPLFFQELFLDLGYVVKASASGAAHQFQTRFVDAKAAAAAVGLTYDRTKSGGGADYEGLTGLRFAVSVFAESFSVRIRFSVPRTSSSSSSAALVNRLLHFANEWNRQRRLSAVSVIVPASDDDDADAAPLRVMLQCDTHLPVTVWHEFVLTEQEEQLTGRERQQVDDEMQMQRDDDRFLNAGILQDLLHRVLESFRQSTARLQSELRALVAKEQALRGGGAPAS
jgi:hypothetical protein